jgi:hypothetical protein
MTNTDREELKKIQLAKKDLGIINKPFFRVDIIDADIDDFDSILRQITSGYITIRKIRSKLPSTGWKSILSQFASRSTYYTTDEEGAGNVHLLIFSSMELSIAGQIQKLGLTQDEIGIEISQLHQRLDTSNLDDGNINNLVLLFPIYCRHSAIMKSEPNNLIAKYEIHNLLINECTARIVDVVLLSNIDEVQNINGDIAMVELPPIPKTMLEKRIAKIQIWHDDLGLVREDSINTDNGLEHSDDVKVPYSEQVFIVHGHDSESKY